mgnify:CR=1 FL=1
MDPIPFLIGAEEWKSLEAGLIQRAKLLNAIVHDIYGDQTLLQRNLLPSSLVYGNPAFMRPMRGINPPGGVHLHFMARYLPLGPGPSPGRVLPGAQRQPDQPVGPG